MARAKKTTGKVLRSDEEHGSVLFVAFIPSRDKDGEPLPAGEHQQLWANEVGDLFADSYGGATEMPIAKGKWRNDDKKIITEDVVLIHSYATEDHAADEARMHKLAVLLHRMGKKTKQGEVGIVIDGIFYKIRNFVLADERATK